MSIPVAEAIIQYIQDPDGATFDYDHTEKTMTQFQWLGTREALVCLAVYMDTREDT